MRRRCSRMRGTASRRWRWLCTPRSHDADTERSSATPPAAIASGLRMSGWQRTVSGTLIASAKCSHPVLVRCPEYPDVEKAGARELRIRLRVSLEVSRKTARYDVG